MKKKRKKQDEIANEKEKRLGRNNTTKGGGKTNKQTKIREHKPLSHLMRLPIVIPAPPALLAEVPVAAVLPPAPPIVDTDESMYIVTLMLPLDAFVHSPVPACLWYLVSHVDLCKIKGRKILFSPCFKISPTKSINFISI